MKSPALRSRVLPRFALASLVCVGLLAGPIVASGRQVISFGREAAQPDTESLGGTEVNISEPVDLDTGVIKFSELSELVPLVDLDAFHMFPNGNVLFSGDTYIFGVPDVGTVNPADVIEYSPLNDSFSVYFSHTNFVGLANVDAVSVLPNGNLLLSTKTGANLPGVGDFQDGDVIEWNGSTATIFLAEGDLFTFGANNAVDAVHAFDGDTIAVSPRTNGIGELGTNALPYGNDLGDLFKINVRTGVALRILDAENLWDSGNTRQTDAVFVTPPVTCPCFDANFLVTQIPIITDCFSRQSPIFNQERVTGVDSDECPASARTNMSFDDGVPVRQICRAIATDLVGPACSIVENTGNVPISVDEFMACAALIQDRCSQ